MRLVMQEAFDGLVAAKTKEIEAATVAIEVLRKISGGYFQNDANCKRFALPADPPESVPPRCVWNFGSREASGVAHQL